MTAEGTGPAGVIVRTAAPDEAGTVATVLDAALLSYPAGAVDDAIDRGDCLVAVDRRPVGACLLEPRGDAVHVVAIAVLRSHRARGIGRALIERAAERGRLTAAFRPAVRPFYEACGFRIEPHPEFDDLADCGDTAEATPADGERLWGVLDQVAPHRQ